MAKESQKSEIDKLRSQAKISGLDVDGLIGEIAEEVAKKLPVQPPLDEIIEKASLATESRIAVKLTNVLEEIKASADGNKPDSEAIIKGVASLLQPQIVEAAKQAVQVAFQDPEIARQMAAQAKQIFENTARDAGVTTPAGQPIGNMTLGGLFQVLLGNVEGIAKLVQAVRPTHSTDEKIADTLQGIFKWHNLLTRLEKGQTDVNALEKGITEITGKK